MKKLVFPQEIEVWYILPAIRKQLAAKLVDSGMSQKEVAKLMQLTEAAISQYKKLKRAKENIFNPEIDREIEKSVKEILKDTDKAKKQIDKAKTKIKEEKVDKINLTDMDSKMMKMKVLLLTYQILHQLKNCMERQKKFPSLTTTTSSLILRKNRLYVRQDII